MVLAERTDRPVGEERLLLEQMFARALGRPATLRRVTRTPSPFATLAAAEVVSGEIEGGGETALFVKHLPLEPTDDPEKERRDREIRIYEELLQGRDLPVPRYFGSRRNDASGCVEVYLEHIDDWNLKYQALEHWFAAARRLAALHAHFARREAELRASDFLLRFDARWFSGWAARAAQAAGANSAECRAALGRIASDYDRVTEVLTAPPATLVHNDLAPKNVIADRSCDPARICIVDWEMAGVGCGVLDVVHLKYGLDAESDRRMRAEYCDALSGTGLLPPCRQDIERLFAACDLHKTLHRLSFSRVWELPAERILVWVRDAERLFGEVRD
jgi:aminoglycoside phosphotransferase (APT) family kinase protein